MNGLGAPIGVNDHHGKPIHIGDTLRFDEREWGGPGGCEFVVALAQGAIQHKGGVGDLSSWCEIIKPWDADQRKPPKRHIEFECKIGADSMDDLEDVLSNMALDVRTGKMSKRSVSGGAGSGYVATLEVNEGVTHDSYATALDRYLEATKEKS